MMVIKEEEILFIDAKFKHKKKTHHLDGVVYKHNNDFKYWNHLELKKKRGINEPVHLYDLKDDLAFIFICVSDSSTTI